MTPKQLRDAATKARGLFQALLDAGDRLNAEKALMAALRYEALMPDEDEGPDWTDVKLKSDSRPFIDDEYFLPKTKK